jgi:two-component system chemotaxis response regulator CheY
MKIFAIVDDSPVIRKVARRILENLGFIVVEAPDGHTALHLCHTNMPDAVLLDWDLPDMPGLDVARGISQLPQAENCRIIYMTSELLIPEMARAKRAGATAFMMKPFNRKVIADKLAELGLSAESQEAA